MTGGLAWRLGLASFLSCDPTATMHALHQSHLAEGTETFGFNIEENVPHDAAAAGIFDLYATKLNAMVRNRF